MRARQEEILFSQWLLQLGNGTLPSRQSPPFVEGIQIPDECVEQNASITTSMYHGVSPDQFVSRVVLTPTNEDSLAVNEEVLQLLPGEEKIYDSADEVVSDGDDETDQYTVEFLNSITPSGMPPHRLKLKVGAVVMLLRNLDLKKGLCNGTRLVVKALHNKVIDAEVVTGVASGKRVFIPRIQLTPSDTGLPFILSRRQFPLRLAYSMTINKAQGQTFEKVGLYLQRPCFSHGQLYVAFSRARAFADIKVKILETTQQGRYQGKYYTQNIVYRQVLL